MKGDVSSNSVYLVGFWPDYEEFFFEDLSTKHLIVNTFNPTKTIGPKKVLIKGLIRSAKNKIYIKRIKCLMARNEEAFFIFQDSRLLLEFLAKSSVDQYRCSVMFRNTVKPEQRILILLKQLKDKNIPIWSFDFKDCHKYGFRLYPQFIKKYNDLSIIKPSYDFSFVGRDKNRSKWLYEFKDRVESRGLSVYLDIRGAKNKDSLTYKEYLTGMCKGRCFIDLVQSNQSGMTLRPLEAVLYGRKVISNNPNIKEKFKSYTGVFKYFDEKDFDFDDLLFKQKQFKNEKVCSPSEVIKLILEYQSSMNSILLGYGVG